MTGRPPAVDGGAAEDAPEHTGAGPLPADQQAAAGPESEPESEPGSERGSERGSGPESTSDSTAGSARAAGARGSGEERPPPFREMMLDSIGGWRGMFDSGFPVVVFVVANAIGGLHTAIWAAVAAGLLLMTLRLARKQSVQQSLSGFVGVAVASFIAARTGQAKGYFLLGIWASFGYAAVFAGSVLVRWPLVGAIWEYVDGGGKAWRRERPMMRIYTWTTLLWTLVFLARGLVQRFLYDQDRTGWLAFTRLAMGYPLTAVAFGVTLLAVRRARRVRELRRAGEAAGTGSGTGSGADAVADTAEG